MAIFFSRYAGSKGCVCSGVIPFPRMSNAAGTAEEADLDPQAAGKDPVFTCFGGSNPNTSVLLFIILGVGLG
jgi:hypothetical protein